MTYDLLMVFKRKQKDVAPQRVWARPGMEVVFRGEIMPGRSREERTYKVEKVMPSSRVKLFGFDGEHSENEFEPHRFEQRKID